MQREPDNSGRPAGLDAALAEFMRRMDAGEKIDQEKFIASHPALAADLRKFFSHAAALSRMADGPTADFTAPQQMTDDVPLGQSFGRYRIITEIARGGMGIVYTARQTDLDRVVCLKVLHAGGATGDWLVREALTLAKFSHPNIVPIYDAGVIDGRYFYTMEYVEGRTLTQAIDGRPMDPQIAAGVALEIATALAYAHDNGVIHRDVKPRNVLISTAVAGGSMRPDDWRAARVRVADFGLALPIGESSMGGTLRSSVVGTPTYMSPEQARGDVDGLDGRTDVYSLGIVLYEMLTGTPPLANLPNRELLRRIRDEKTETPLPSSVMPNVDRELELVCGKAMRKDRNERYGSAKEMADDLRRYLAGEKVQAKPDRRALRRKLKWAAAAAALAGAILVATMAIFDPFGLQGPTQIAWSDAAAHVGDELDVEMLGAYTLGRNMDLVLDPAPGDPSSFEVIVPSEFMSGVPSKLDSKYQQERMIVRGRIEEENGRPFVRLANPQDIRFDRRLTSEERIETEIRFARVHVPRDDNVVNWREAAKHMGEDATVEGNVLAVSESDTALRINIGFLGRQSVAAVVFSEYLPNFGTGTKDTYAGKRVRVAGRLTTRDGRPEIHVRLPSQLKVVGVASGEFEENGPVVPFQEAAAHINELATVEGDVVHVGHSGTACYLNMGGTGPAAAFTAYIPSDAEPGFPNGFDTFYAGKRLQVSGEIYLRDGKPYIRLDHPYQVRVVGTATPTSAAPVEVISVEDARDHVGQVRTVQARVSDVVRGDAYAYIHFEDSPLREGFFVHVPSSALEKMPNGFENYFANRELQVTGEIKLRNGQPLIVVNDNRQIRVVPKSEESNREGSIGSSESTKSIQPADAVRFVDQVVTVEGDVASVNRQERQAIVNFDGQRSDGFYVFIPASSFARLPSGFEQFYAGKRIQVTGRVQLHEARPQIVVNQADQIRVVLKGEESKNSDRIASTTPAISAKDAGDYVGQRCTIAGRVKGVNKTEKFAYIDLEGVNDPKGLSLFVPSSAFASMPDGFEEYYKGRDVRITGVIKLYKGRPSITVTNQQQVIVLPRGSKSQETSKAEPVESPKAIEPGDAVRFVDQDVTVQAVVKDVNRQERQAIVAFVGQGDDGFYLFIPSSAFARLPSGFEDFYRGKRVQVTGRVKLYKAQPQIVVTQPNQIRVIHDKPAADEKPAAATPTAAESNK